VNTYSFTDHPDREKWSEFVQNHPRGNIFQTPEMYEIYGQARNNETHIGAVLNAQGNILGILSSVVQEDFRGFLGYFTARAINWGGPLIVHDDPGVLSYLLGQYNRQFKKKVIFSQFRNFWDQEESKSVFVSRGYGYQEHLNFLVDLELNEDELWKRVHSKRRNEIRRAKKEGTRVQEITGETGIIEAYAILGKVYKKAGLPLHHQSLFMTAFRELHPPGMIRFFGAYLQDKLIGTMVVLCFKDTLYDWYAGSLRQYYNKYPNDLLPWEVFLWGKRQGYKTFDFGGAGHPDKPYGVRDYKKKFGGRQVCFGRYTRVHKPLLMKTGTLGLKIRQTLSSKK